MSIAESIPTRVAAQMAAPAAAAGTRTAFTALRTSTVMMVDDDPLMLEVVQTYLEEAGYVSFITTSQPKEAMGLFVQHRPDILLLDLMMPEVSGFDILAEVRGHEELRYTPVIILTAESDPTAKLKALELGATDLLTKPVDPSELRLRLRNALAFKAYQDRLVDSDPLTGLPNRKKFRVEVEAALARSAATSSRACTLLHIDLDRFKQVNDSLGHRVGDHLLSAVAKVLESVFASFKPSQATGRDAVVAFSRIGGNGFASAAPRPAQPHQGGRCHSYGQARPECAIRAVRDRRAQAAHEREHRHRGLAGGRRRCRCAAQERRSGHVSVQAARPEDLHVLLQRDEQRTPPSA